MTQWLCAPLVILLAAPVSWNKALSQPPGWYAGEEAIRIADNVLLYQRGTGGWHKNVDMATPLSNKEKAVLLRDKKEADATIDNKTTYTQMEYLARVHTATKHERFQAGFVKGLDYLLQAQYSNGGWPQYFPLRKGYYTHITFNDDAMIGVLNLLRAVARREEPFGFVDATRRARADAVVAKGIECILKCQVVVKGRRTAWCAQHDETTFAPAPARAYELVSLSGSESVGIVRFLMGIERPDARVSGAIRDAVAWFRTVQLSGIRVADTDASLPGGRDRVVVADSVAPPLWARFYTIDTSRPIFAGRDGIIKTRLADIEHERRVGYAWYTASPARLLEREFPAWEKKNISKEK